jgi:two-component system LytT family sensor kinase
MSLPAATTPQFHLAVSQVFHAVDVKNAETFSTFFTFTYIMNRKFNNAIVEFVRRYKLLHIAFWVWHFLSSYHLFTQLHPQSKSSLYDAVVLIFSQICGIYFMTGWLMPRFMQKGRYVMFGILTLSTVLASAALKLGLQEIYLLVNLGRHMHSFMVPILFISTVTDTFLLTALFFAVYTAQHWFYTQRQNRLLEKERLESELNFLKAQINPHFLFNVINSVYVLIEEDKKLASQALLQFSDLLRYQLYDCTNKLTSFSRELEFLNDYVNLERLRIGESVEVKFHSDVADDNLEIAPFILIPFIENAFKHRSHNKGGNYIYISTNVKNNVLHFSVKNTYDELDAPNKTQGGIGLVNAQRRLDLLYLDRHEMVVSKADGVYEMNLKIDMNEN